MAINVVNKYKHIATDNDVYIGRGSKLGNPFTHITDKQTLAQFIVPDRDTAVNNCEDYLRSEIAAKNKSICNELNRIYKMAKTGNVNLVCFCYPKTCHGDIIKKIIEEQLTKNS